MDRLPPYSPLAVPPDNLLSIMQVKTMTRKRSRSKPGVLGDSDHAMCHAPSMPEPERLVGLGFRYWMLGRKSGDIACWERTWNLYSGVFGLCGARQAVGTLSCWVGALNQTAAREIEVFPETCPGFCRDECIAVSMIAACQHNTCPAMRACAFALVESSLIERVVGEAQAFADTMASLEQRLSPLSIVSVAATPQPANRLPS